MSDLQFVQESPEAQQEMISPELVTQTANAAGADGGEAPPPFDPPPFSLGAGQGLPGMQIKPLLSAQPTDLQTENIWGLAPTEELERIQMNMPEPPQVLEANANEAEANSPAQLEVATETPASESELSGPSTKSLKRPFSALNRMQEQIKAASEKIIQQVRETLERMRELDELYDVSAPVDLSTGLFETATFEDEVMIQNTQQYGLSVPVSMPGFTEGEMRVYHDENGFHSMDPRGNFMSLAEGVGSSFFTDAVQMGVLVRIEGSRVIGEAALKIGEEILTEGLLDRLKTLIEVPNLGLGDAWENTELVFSFSDGELRLQLLNIPVSLGPNFTGSLDLGFVNGAPTASASILINLSENAQGLLELNYENEAFSGSAKVNFTHGPAFGEVDVVFEPGDTVPRVHGSGRVVTDRFSGGVEFLYAKRSEALAVLTREAPKLANGGKDIDLSLGSSAGESAGTAAQSDGAAEDWVLIGKVDGAVQVTDQFEVTGTGLMDPDHGITVALGVLQTDNVTLIDQIDNSFNFSEEFPVAGYSIPHVGGVTIDITASMGMESQLGPLVLTGVQASGVYSNSQESWVPNVDPNIEGSLALDSTLDFLGSLGIEGKVAALGNEARLGVRGDLDVGATVNGTLAAAMSLSHDENGIKPHFSLGGDATAGLKVGLQGTFFADLDVWGKRWDRHWDYVFAREEFDLASVEMMFNYDPDAQPSFTFGHKEGGSLFSGASWKDTIDGLHEDQSNDVESSHSGGERHTAQGEHIVTAGVDTYLYPAGTSYDDIAIDLINQTLGEFRGIRIIEPGQEWEPEDDGFSFSFEKMAVFEWIDTDSGQILMRFLGEESLDIHDFYPPGGRPPSRGDFEFEFEGQNPGLSGIQPRSLQAMQSTEPPTPDGQVPNDLKEELVGLEVAYPKQGDNEIHRLVIEKENPSEADSPLRIVRHSEVHPLVRYCQNLINFYKQKTTLTDTEENSLKELEDLHTELTQKKWKTDVKRLWLPLKEKVTTGKKKLVDAKAEARKATWEQLVEYKEDMIKLDLRTEDLIPSSPAGPGSTPNGLPEDATVEKLHFSHNEKHQGQESTAWTNGQFNPANQTTASQDGIHTAWNWLFNQKLTQDFYVAFHLLHFEFGGKADTSNLVATPKKVNTRFYNQFEKLVINQLDQGKVIWVNVHIDYHGGAGSSTQPGTGVSEAFPSRITASGGTMSYKTDDNDPNAASWEKNTDVPDFDSQTIPLPEAPSGNVMVNNTNTLTPAHAKQIGVTKKVINFMRELKGPQGTDTVDDDRAFFEEYLFEKNSAMPKSYSIDNDNFWRANYMPNSLFDQANIDAFNNTSTAKLKNNGLLQGMIDKSDSNSSKKNRVKQVMQKLKANLIQF